MNRNCHVCGRLVTSPVNQKSLHSLNCMAGAFAITKTGFARSSTKTPIGEQLRRVVIRCDVFCFEEPSFQVSIRMPE